MHILGMSNGTRGGNSETLMKIALKAAMDSDPSITTSWVHIPSVSIPLNARNLEGAQDMSLGMLETLSVKEVVYNVPDDRRAVLDAVLDADALICASPTYSHQPPGAFKALVDRIMGPFTDVSFAKRALERQKAGDPAYANQKIDLRLLKPRVIGFLAVSGSTTPDQYTLTLPGLHLMVYPLQAKVVDQVQFFGVGAPGAVLMEIHIEKIRRAERLGKNVASQLGKEYNDAQYLGDRPRGACPYCNLAKIDLYCEADNSMACAVCGAQGKMVVGSDGVIETEWVPNCDICSLTLAGKIRHLDDTVRIVAFEQDNMKHDRTMKVRRDYWNSVHIPHVSMPSIQEGLQA